MIPAEVEAKYAEACGELGVTHIWESLTEDTPTERMLRNIFGAVMLGVVEQQAERVAA